MAHFRAGTDTNQSGVAASASSREVHANPLPHFFVALHCESESRVSDPSRPCAHLVSASASFVGAAEIARRCRRAPVLCFFFAAPQFSIAWICLGALSSLIQDC